MGVPTWQSSSPQDTRHRKTLIMFLGEDLVAVVVVVVVVYHDFLSFPVNSSAIMGRMEVITLCAPDLLS